MRRTSPITQYAAAAASEALEKVKGSSAKPPKLGLVVCLYCGCIQHSYRFFDEALKDPATASPLVFPETVFAAPASHLAALFEAPLVSTLVGDPATMLQGFAVAIDWLLDGQVDACLVVGAEETNWMLADALWHFDHRSILGGGAGAVCLTLDPALSLGVEVGLISSAHTYHSNKARTAAGLKMRQQLPAKKYGQLLCDGLQGLPKSDAPEIAAWRDWDGPRLSVKRILGEGLMAAAAWQCVAACDALAERLFDSALVSLVGCNQQAIGAYFQREK